MIAEPAVVSEPLAPWAISPIAVTILSWLTADHET